MDDTDRAILSHLRAEGRLTNQELAERVGLTPAPCLRRVRRLEEDGVITGYTAHYERWLTTDIMGDVAIARMDSRLTMKLLKN